jgi:hypothetical protein
MNVIQYVNESQENFGREIEPVTRLWYHHGGIGIKPREDEKNRRLE